MPPAVWCSVSRYVVATYGKTPAPAWPPLGWNRLSGWTNGSTCRAGSVRQASELLTGWAAEPRAMAGRRDDVVLAAVGTDPGKAGVHRLTGIARTTIGRIVGAAPAAAGGSR